MTDRLAAFAAEVHAALEANPAEPAALPRVREAMRRLVAQDDWLPGHAAQPDPQRYQQYLLHRDPAGRFSVVSFVWGPGQATPVHDHTVWGVIGMLRGAELCQAYDADATPPTPTGAPLRLSPGDVTCVSPTLGDVHQVSNAFPDRPSISIHCYGADIGTVRRHAWDASGQRKDFVSGYSAAASP